MAILKIRDSNGNVQEVLAIKGEKGDKGDKGDAGQIKMLVVATLPDVGADDTIYLLPNTDGATENSYDEYIYINNAWEKIGGASVQVDLTDYVKYNTDTTWAGGYVVGGIGKEATQRIGIDECNGLTILNGGHLSVSACTEGQITTRTDKPINGHNLNFAVKAALTDANRMVLTEEEKANARDTLGYVTKNDIPDVSGFTTMTAVEEKGYQTNAQVLALIQAMPTETWTLTLEDGSTVTKKVVLQ